MREDGQLTSVGFRFVLDDRQRQLWALALAFLERARAGKEHLGPLRLLLTLGEAKIGQCLDLGAQTAKERFLVDLLVDLGVLYSAPSLGGSQPMAHWATPAALAMFRQDASATLSRNIAGTAAELELPAHLYHESCRRPERHAEAKVLQDEQGIIVESNFKVYAYTSSALHVCLLGLFCKMVTRLPNLYVGHLSAEPALRAMKQGIRVENIVRYLEAAAHPRALKRLEEGSSVVPANVRGQLEVWESSRSRTKCSRAVLFEWETGELDADTFERLRKSAEEKGALLWSRCAAAARAQQQQPAEQDGAGLFPMALAVTATGASVVRSLLGQQRGLPAGGLLRLRGTAPREAIVL
uniref:General transcription factor IIH subunit 4 n=1 Tax=Alexandrium catenella TaxID=2925 RepID=A0A7S1LNI5_ALECA